MYLYACTVCTVGLMPSSAEIVPFTVTRGRLEINFHSPEDWLSYLAVLLRTSSASQIGALLNPEKKKKINLFYLSKIFSLNPKSFLFLH